MTLLKFVLAIGSVVALSASGASDVNAQGFRIGNVIQAGNGQGFRIGGPRAGMHFGGGQGASIGTQRVGMRFGNGQGARFGGANYGMQFGGQQGTQIGRFSTVPSVAPGTYYYGDQYQGYAQTPVYQAAPQQTFYGSTTTPVAGSSIISPTTHVEYGVVQVTQPDVPIQSSFDASPPQLTGAIPNAPTANASTAIIPTQQDIARQTTTSREGTSALDHAETNEEAITEENAHTDSGESVLIVDDTTIELEQPIDESAE